MIDLKLPRLFESYFILILCIIFLILDINYFIQIFTKKTKINYIKIFLCLINFIITLLIAFMVLLFITVGDL